MGTRSYLLDGIDRIVYVYAREGVSHLFHATAIPLATDQWNSNQPTQPIEKGRWGFVSYVNHEAEGQR